MSKRLKDIIKQNPEPAKGRFGVNPMDPWSAKAGLAEDNMLNKFLSSRGINPGFVSKDTKISHAKSSAFLKWKQEHTFESVEINEDRWLDRFLSSRGVDPKFVTRDQKVSYSKSGEFSKWLRDHKNEEFEFNEETDKEDVLSFDIPLFIRILELAREDVKEDMELHRITERLLSIRKKGTLTMADYDFVSGIKKIKEQLENICEVSGMGLRYAGVVKRGPKTHTATQDDHDTVKRHLKNLMAIDSDEPTATSAVHKAIRKLSAVGQNPTRKRNKELLGAMVQKHHIPIDQHHRSLLNTEETKTSLQKFRAAADQREKKHNDIEKARQERLHQDPSKVTIPVANTSKDDMSSAIDRLEKHLNKEKVELVENELQDLSSKHGWKYKQQTYGGELNHPKHGKISINRYGEWHHHKDDKSGGAKAQGDYDTLGKHLSSLKEEVEQITELKKTTVKSWLKQQKVVPDKKPGMDRKSFNQRVKLRSKSWDRALDRISGHKPTSEAVFQDPQAATQSPSDGANNPNETSENKRQMSKSARMIKALYKSKNMKEDMHDWEKEDKSIQTYGKKPKISLTDKEDNMGENKPEALAIMTGGKTLTGQARDTVEIDPAMKKRPGQPDSGPKQDGKIR